MKRCPECYEAYVGSEKFCELDGQALLADPTVVPDDPPRGLPQSQNTLSNQSTQQREIWFVGGAGLLLGIVVCLGGYLAYGLWSEDSGIKESSAPAFASQTQSSIQPTSRPPAAPPQASAPPEETATPETEASPEPQPAPTNENAAVAVRLNQGPVSTGQRKKGAEEAAAGQTVIEMNDGTAVEVDAAWEDAQGVWYRRGGMVAFVESQRVKAITGRAAQKPSSVTQ